MVDYELFAIEEVEEGKNYWSKIGVGFLNKDGSINLKVNLLPLSPHYSIQLRIADPDKAKKDSNEVKA